MTPRQVQVWFQNKRAKEKRQKRKSARVTGISPNKTVTQPPPSPMPIQPPLPQQQEQLSQPEPLLQQSPQPQPQPLPILRSGHAFQPNTALLPSSFLDATQSDAYLLSQ